MTGEEASVRSSGERGGPDEGDHRGGRDEEPDQYDESNASAEEEATQETTDAEDDSLGWRGWVVVAGLVVSFIVVPWVIILLPEAQGVLEAIGLGWRDAYLVLPLLPALGLGTLAVWAAVASRQ